MGQTLADRVYLEIEEGGVGEASKTPTISYELVRSDESSPGITVDSVGYKLEQSLPNNWLEFRLLIRYNSALINTRSLNNGGAKLMVESLVEQIIHKIDQAAQLYYRLILVVAPSGMGKTKALRELAKHTELGYTNVNLELSQRLLGLTERQRPLQVFRLLSEIVEENGTQVVLLDNIELLFDPSLKQDPLRLLQGISRNRTVVASWNGSIEHEHLIYARPDHPEYRRYPTTDLMVVEVEQPR